MSYYINKLIKQMPNDLTDMEKVRYLYLKCGERFSYDRDYMYMDSLENAKKIYEKNFNWSNVKIKNEKSFVTCNQIASACTDAINTLAIKGKTNSKIFAKNIGYVSGEEFHVATLLYLDDDIYFLDLYKDLYRIQKGFKTKYFAPTDEVLEEEKRMYPSVGRELNGISCKTISDSEIMEMDKKCGYNSNGIYMDDAIELLKQEMQDPEKIKEFINKCDSKDKKDIIYEWKLDFIFKYLMNAENNKGININEMTKYFLKVYHTIMSEQERRENLFTSIDIHYKGTPSVLFDIYGKNRQLMYLYKGKGLGFEKITGEDINQIKQKRNANIYFDHDGLR